MRMTMSCTAEAAALSLDALCLELLGSMDGRSPAVPASPPPWLGRALELLCDRYRDELSVAEIAAAAGVHPIHLARTFRRFLRCTPGQFARFRRLEQAARQLLRSTRPLAEVALCCGFADQSHLSRAFTRHYGLPPGEYRKEAGGACAGGGRFQIDKTHASR
jgi:AraC family transcriptional regulator